MTEREALKLALEALVEMTPSGPNGSAIWHKQMSAITAASEALAQPEQELVRIMGFNCVCGRRMEVSAEQGVIPAPQRTWVGLSVFEINDLVENTEYEDYRDLIERTEAKLKGKNND